MGLAQGATLRIAGERTRMAMPETAIGLFPDVGGSYFLSRLPGRTGRYIALAGRTMRAADALHCGLANGYLPPQGHEALDAPLRAAAASSDAREALRGLAPPPAGLPQGELERHRPAIDRHFAHDSVEAILDSLAAERAPEHAPWARDTLEALSRSSPTMLEVTLEQLRRGATLSLADCFRMELGMVYHCFEHGDVFEGVRALLVDKDNAPRWNPATLAEVGRDRVEAFFRPRWNPQDHPLAHLRP
jgi:enoyl-CoA hydratase/carnithine racemase